MLFLPQDATSFQVESVREKVMCDEAEGVSFFSIFDCHG